jgi:hypothetical protein
MVPESFRCLKTAIKIDVLSMVHRSSKVADLRAVLVRSVCRNLKLAENSFLKQLSDSEGTSFVLSAPEPYHFLPPGCGHFVTVMYPKKKPDSELGMYLSSHQQEKL